MDLLGKINLDGLKYFIVLNETKQCQTWYLFSEIRRENLAKVGASRFEGSLSEGALYDKSVDKLPFFLEGIKRYKITGKTASYGNPIRINRILKAYLDCKEYSYSKNDIIANTCRYTPEKFKYFKAVSNECSIDYETRDNSYTRLSFSIRNIDLTLTEARGIKLPKGVEFEELESVDSLNLKLINLDTPDVKTLSNVVDLSWYRDSETNTVKKSYVSCKTIIEFESKCVTPMVRKIIEEVSKGNRPVISCDTETTGLNLYYLSDDNPTKDRISTIQFAWEDNQAVIVYLDMEYIDNVDKKYVFERLKDIFGYHYKKPEIKMKLLYDEKGNPIDKEYTLRRKSYDLTGHNVIFDSRVTLSEGHQFFFNHDTLQMIFNLDPTTVKGSKGLKPLERFFFNETPPELSDLLGKGNEGMFRYLKDDEVARIYGCADADYSRKIFFKLRDLMLSFNPDMYKNYKIACPFSWYVSAQIEYYGNRMDVPMIKEQAKTLKTDIETLEDTIFRYVGSVLSAKMSLNIMEDGEESKKYLNNLSEYLESNNHRYEFKFSNKDLGRVMYKMLEYPVLVRTKKGAPAINSDAMQKFLMRKNKEPIEVLKEDIKSCDGESTLINKDKFNSYKYPIAYLLQERSSRVKEYNNYYAPFEKEHNEGRIFKKVSTSNIETGRMSCAMQTVKKGIKRAVLPFDEDWLMGDWDFSSVEPRMFESFANDEYMIEKLDNPEKDYHTENAALMFGKPAYSIDPDNERKPAKVFGLSIPYGVGDRKLCERIHGEITEKGLIETRILKSKFMNAQSHTMKYLEEIRQSALIPRDVPLELKRLWRMPEDAVVGMVFNKNRDYRYFNLTNVLGNKGLEESVKRQAGNFPIQSYAAFFFKCELERLYKRLIDYGIEDKVRYNMVIHDELLFSFHKSIDPRLIMKIINESLVVRLKGHTIYYVGLDFGKNWYDCKSGKHEIPSLMLMREAKKECKYNEWTEDANAIIDPMIEKYEIDRSYEVIDELIKDNTLNVTNLASRFTNYTVRGYIMNCGEEVAFPPRKRPTKDASIEADQDDTFLGLIIAMLVKNPKYKDLIILGDFGTKTLEEYIDYRKSNNFDAVPDYYKINVKSLVPNYKDSDKFEDEIDNDSLYGWSLDEDEDEDVNSDSYVNHVISMYDYSDFNLSSDTDFSMDICESSYKFVKDFNRSIILKLEDKSKLKELELIVKDYSDPQGVKIRIETPTRIVRLVGTYSIDKDRLEKYLGGMVNGRV